MLGRGNRVDYPLGADLYPFSAKTDVGAGLPAIDATRCARHTTIL